MIFEYHEKMSTIDQLTISVADLRDLIQARSILDDQQAMNEYKLILDSILHKNRLDPHSITLRVDCGTAKPTP